MTKSNPTDESYERHLSKPNFLDSWQGLAAWFALATGLILVVVAHV